MVLLLHLLFAREHQNVLFHNTVSRSFSGLSQSEVEAAIEDIKKTAEEAVDGLQSQFEGRKSLKKLREERVSARPKKTNPSI